MRKSDLLYRLLTGFCFTKQFNCTDNKDEVNRFFSLTFSVSLRLWCLTVVTSTNIVSRLALFQLHRTLKCPQSRHWISAPGWLFMLMTSTSVSHVEEDKKKEYFLRGAAPALWTAQLSIHSYWNFTFWLQFKSSRYNFNA